MACLCDEGFEAVDLACLEVTGCDAASCDANASCSDATGAAECTCNEGYVGDGTLCEVAPFTIAVLGDTQGYVDDSKNGPDELRAAGFTEQVKWIVDNQSAESIRFVSHVGDVVEHNTVSEWNRALAALNQLFALPDLPWSVNLGNHDYEPETEDASRYLEAFGPDAFSASPWYGSDEGFRGVGVGGNSYQRINLGHRTYLHLNLEMNASDTALAWAQSIVNEHLGMATILSVHEFLNDQRPGAHPQASATEIEVMETPQMNFQRRNSATRIWNKLIRNNRQIFLTFNGHHCCERELVQYNDAGFPVLHAQVNYSVAFAPILADAGWIRLVELDEAAGEIRFRSFKPAVPLHNFEEESPLPGSVVTYEMDWRGRFSTEVQTFSEGENGYAGTEDLWFSSREAETQPNPNETFIRTGLFDIGEDTIHQQGLVQFSELFGNAQGQVLPGANIVSATLAFSVPTDIPDASGEAQAVHAMLTDWSESTAAFADPAWSGGPTLNIDANGVEASQEAIASCSAFTDSGLGDANTSVIEAGQSIHYDVTSVVQSWGAGEGAFGFLLEGLGTGGGNGLFLASSEYAGTGSDPRPRLTIAYDTKEHASFQQGERGYLGAVDTWIEPANPSANHGGEIDLHCLNTSFEEQTLVRFKDLFGTELRSIPIGATIHSARLIVTSSQAVFAGTGAEHGLHRMLVPWQSNVSWDAAQFGGNGVQLDGAEAFPTAESRLLVGIGDDATVGFDVTESVRAWSRGAENHGWVLVQGAGDDRWFLSSSESNFLARRPRLEVQYTVE